MPPAGPKARHRLPVPFSPYRITKFLWNFTTLFLENWFSTCLFYVLLQRCFMYKAFRTLTPIKNAISHQYSKNKPFWGLLLFLQSDLRIYILQQLLRSTHTAPSSTVRRGVS